MDFYGKESDKFEVVSYIPEVYDGYKADVVLYQLDKEKVRVVHYTRTTGSARAWTGIL